MVLNLLRTKIKQIKQIRDLQKVAVDMTPDDYMVGLYNGLEMAVAILEKREPDFMYCVRDAEVIEGMEEIERVGRTVASGVIRKGKNRLSI